MRRRLVRALVIVVALAAPALHAADRSGEESGGNEAGDFAYYVLALSWSPTWCALEGEARGAEQCDPARDHGWLLHGLWPQHARGWPADCPSGARDPARSQTAAMADIMGSGGLAWHQWRKHGRCTGLTAADYFALSRSAWQRFSRPAVFAGLERAVRLPASVVEEAWLAENPEIRPEGLTVTCRQGHVQEVRLCLTRALEPRPCGADIARDCPLTDALLPPIP